MDEYLIRPSDAINAAIEAMDKHCNGYNSFRDMRIRKAIEGVPSAGRPQEWIPCSERLPEKDGFYLVTITDGEQIAVCKMPFVEFEWKDNWFDDEVIAWMPLPSAYQREGADDETDNI